MIAILGFLLLFVVAGNLIAYYLGLTNRDWLAAMEIHRGYAFTLMWAILLLLGAIELGVPRSFGVTFSLGLVALILGYLTELWDHRFRQRHAQAPRNATPSAARPISRRRWIGGRRRF